MTWPHAFTVTVRRYGDKDRWGKRTLLSVHTVDGCFTYPRVSTESDDQRTTVVTSEVLVAPYRADIRPTDEVELPDGRRFHVEGTPARWASPFTGWRPGLELRIEEVRG